MYAFWAYDGSLASQLQGESIHLAFLALVGGVGIISSAVGFLLRRDIKRADEDRKAIAASLVLLEGKVDDNDRRHGYEISDIKIAVAPLFSKAELEQPDYPSR